MLDVIRKWTPEQRALLTALYETGIPFADIAAEINSKFGTSYTDKAIVMQGFVLGLRRPARVPGSQWSEEQNAEIRRHVEAGLPHRAIAKAMDVKAGSLWHQLRRLGLNRTE